MLERFCHTLKDDRRYGNFELGYNLGLNGGFCILRFRLLNERPNRNDEKEMSRGKEGAMLYGFTRKWNLKDKQKHK